MNEDGLEVIEITDISYEAFTNCFRREYGDKVAESYLINDSIGPCVVPDWNKTDTVC